MYKACHDCKSQLLIFPENLHPDKLSYIFNMEPTTKQVKGEYRENFEGKKILIKRSQWFIISEYHVPSKDLREHILWLIPQLKHFGNLPYYLQSRIQEISLPTNFNVEIGMIISCTWNPLQDHGGPMLSSSLMESLAELSTEFAIDIYFLYEISTIQGFMEAAEILNIGKDLTHHDWLHILAFIKKFHNIPPSMLGTVCPNGDFLDDDGNVICNIRDYVS